MNFPKNHMLSKYVEDMRHRGVPQNYSTSQTEAQHKEDAKKAAKRTNKQRLEYMQQVWIWRTLISPFWRCD